MRRIASLFVAGALIASSLVGCIASNAESEGGSSEAYTFGPIFWKPPPPPDIPMNGLPTQALAQNLLSTNLDNSKAFVSHPLATRTFKSGDPNSVPSLVAATSIDAQTNDFLRYVVTCALNPTDHVVVGGVDMKGQLGLCPAWANGSADVACQQRVSACLVMFNNPLFMTVPLSVRGAQDSSGTPIALASNFKPAHVAQQEWGYGPTEIASLQACTGPAYGVQTACGWNQTDALTGLVGSCVPGVTVHVGAGGVPTCGGTPLGTATGDTVLRVCKGLRGCDPGSSDELGSNDDSCPGVNFGSYVTFTCPDSGAFSVEAAPYDRSASITATIRASTDTSYYNKPVTYPASESALFTLREGAFWGNIFDTTRLSVSYTKANPNAPYVPTQLLPPGQFPTPYYGMFTCADPGFTKDDAAAIHRVCTSATSSSGVTCAAYPMGSCATSCAAPSDSTTSYGTCNGSPAYTSFLHNLCDMTGTICYAPVVLF